VIDLLTAAGVVVFLDQWTKRMVRVHVSDRCVVWGSVVRIRHVISAREIYTRDGSRAALVLVWLVALACAITLYSSGAKFQSRAAIVGVGAALGGAAGNLLDILHRRSVLDFIDLQWWPVFNLADVFIVGGLAFAFWPGH
jgi:signal peptidase II